MSLEPLLAQTKHPNVDMVAFRFQVTAPAGTADPDALFPGYQGVTDVARTGEGVYEISFDFKYPFMLVALAGVQGDLAAASASTSYNATTGKLTVTTVAGGVAADPADNAWVHVFCVMARMTGTYQTVAI
jgi:hypothetical protein